MWNFKHEQSFTMECQIFLTQTSVKCWLMADCMPPSEFQAQHWFPQHFSMKHTISNSLSILRSNSSDSRLCLHTRQQPGWDPGLLRDLCVLFQALHVLSQAPLRSLHPLSLSLVSGTEPWSSVLSHNRGWKSWVLILTMLLFPLEVSLSLLLSKGMKSLLQDTIPCDIVIK